MQPVKKMIDENSLIFGCRNNDPVCQKYLYEKYYRLFFTICLRYSNSTEQAKDIVHDGFIRIFTSFSKFRSEGTIKSWMSRIITNTAIDYVKKESAFSQKLLISNIEDLADFIDDENINELEKLSPDEILKNIQRLPIGYRTILNMYSIDGYSHSEISQKLNISVSTSKSQLFKARKLLKRICLENINQISDNAR